MPAVKLQPNTPLTLALLNPEGELDERYETVHYSTSHGTLTLSYRQAAKLNILELQAGESFTITKHVREHGSEYSICMAPETEKARAVAEAPQIAKALATPPIATNGATSNGKPKPANGTCYRKALKHINRTVQEVLNASGEQWTAEAKQDLVSTLFIQAAKSKQISFDFTEESNGA